MTPAGKDRAGGSTPTTLGDKVGTINMNKKLTGIQLEDSFVLSWGMDGDSLVFVVELSLWPEHPQYQAPQIDEWTCYQKGKLIFDNVTSLQGLLPIDNVSPSIDANGELDYGNINVLEEVNKGEFKIYGDFGEVQVLCHQMKVEIDAQPDV